MILITQKKRRRMGKYYITFSTRFAKADRQKISLLTYLFTTKVVPIEKYSLSKNIYFKILRRIQFRMDLTTSARLNLNRFEPIDSVSSLENYV